MPGTIDSVMKDVVNTRKRAAVYVRVSTDDQVDKYGLVYQKDDILAWAKYNPHPNTPYRISEEHIFVDDGYSGADDRQYRPQLSRLFEAAERGEFDVVLVWKIDRMARNLEFLLKYIRELSEMNIGFIATTQPEINTTGTTGKLLIAILGILAEIERDHIIERTSAGKLAAARAGKWVGGKYPPYGYDIDAERKMSVNEEEAAIVRQMFRWFVHDRMTIYQIQQRLLALQIPTKADKFVEQRKKKGEKEPKLRSKNPACYWSTSTINRMLGLSAYSGTYYYGKRGKRKDPKTGKKHEFRQDEEAMVQLPCPAIIDTVTYENSLQRLAENKRLASRNSKHSYLFTGKIVCGDCDAPYSGYIKKKFRQKKCIGTYPQYRCRRTNASRAADPCRNTEVSEAKLEREVWKELYAFLNNPRRFIRELQEHENKKSSVQQAKQDLEVTEKALQANSKERERVMSLYEKGLRYQEPGAIESRIAELKKDETQLLKP